MASAAVGTGEPLEPRPPAPRPRAVPEPERRSLYRLGLRHTRRVHAARMGDTPLPHPRQHVEPWRVSEANGDL